MQDKETKLIEKLIDDKEFLTKFSESRSLDEQLEFLKVNGFDFTKEEFKDFIKSLGEAYSIGKSMSEEELENVSGGKMQMRNKIAAAALVFGALGAGSVMGQASAGWGDLFGYVAAPFTTAYSWMTSSGEAVDANASTSNQIEEQKKEDILVSYAQKLELRLEKAKEKGSLIEFLGQLREEEMSLEKEIASLGETDKQYKNGELALLMNCISKVELQISAEKEKTRANTQTVSLLDQQKETQSSSSVWAGIDEFGFPEIPKRPVGTGATGENSEKKQDASIEELQRRLDELGRQPNTSPVAPTQPASTLNQEVQTPIANYEKMLEEAKKAEEPVKAVKGLLEKLEKEKKSLQEVSLNLANEFKGVGEEVVKQIAAARKPIGQEILKILDVIKEGEQWLKQNSRVQTAVKPMRTVTNQTLSKNTSAKAKQDSTRTSAGGSQSTIDEILARRLELERLNERKQILERKIKELEEGSRSNSPDLDNETNKAIRKSSKAELEKVKAEFEEVNAAINKLAIELRVGQAAPVSQKSSGTAQKQVTAPDVKFQSLEGYKAKLVKARNNGTLGEFVNEIEKEFESLKTANITEGSKMSQEDKKLLKESLKLINLFRSSVGYRDAKREVESSKQSELGRVGSKAADSLQAKASTASQQKKVQPSVKDPGTTKAVSVPASAIISQSADDKASELAIKLLGLKDQRENNANEIKSLEETYKFLISEDPNSESSKEAKNRLDELEESLERINAQIKEIEAKLAAQQTKTGVPVSKPAPKAVAVPAGNQTTRVAAPVDATAETHRGIRNLSNTCYLNTALQVLTHESAKADDGKTFREEILSLTDEQVEGTNVLSALRTFFAAYENQKDAGSAPIERETMEQFWQNLAIAGVAAPRQDEQFDTTETLGNIIDKCLEEINTKIRENKDKEDKKNEFSKELREEFKKIREALERLKKTIEQLYAFNYREVDDLDVTKNPGDSEATIRQRIDEKIQREHLTQLKDGRYVKPAKERSVYPSVTLPEAKIDKDLEFNEIFDVELVSSVSLPKNIIIEFKREHYKQVATGEIQNLKLKNPIEILPEITVHGRRYRLKAISIHESFLGDTTGLRGHYYAYCRDSVSPEVWRCYNDGSVNTTFGAGLRQIGGTANLIRNEFVRKNATNLVYEMV